MGLMNTIVSLEDNRMDEKSEKRDPGLSVRLPLTVEERQAYRRYIRKHHIVAGRWVADLVRREMEATHESA